MENVIVFFVALGGLSAVGLVALPLVSFLKSNKDFIEMIAGDID